MRSALSDAFTTPAPREIPIRDLMTSPLQALRSGSLAMASTQRRTSFKKIFDLNSSGGTTASEEACPQPSGASKSSPAPAATDKNDESYVAEYYARAQLANAKMVRQYKTRIDELQKSSFTSIAHHFRIAMHSGGKVIGYLARRLSWAEIMLLGMITWVTVPYAWPRLTPYMRMLRSYVMECMRAMRQYSAAKLRAAAAATAASSLTAMATAVAESTVSPPLLAAAATPNEPDAIVLVVNDKVVMPVGNVSAAVLPVGLTKNDTALCDDGATIDCFLTLDGAIPGTHDSSKGGPLTIGDKESSLASNGVYLYAIERCGANGACQDELFEGHHTPNGVANIMSEAREVNVRKSRIEWCPGMARQFHTVPGPSIPLIMGSNGLGFVTIRPLTDRHRIIRLRRRSALTPPWLLAQINWHGTHFLCGMMSNPSYEVHKC